MDFLYIYNVEQANYYIQEGVNPVGVGINDRTKAVYFKFIRKETNNVYGLWLTKCKQLRDRQEAV